MNFPVDHGFEMRQLLPARTRLPHRVRELERTIFECEQRDIRNRSGRQRSNGGGKLEDLGWCDGSALDDSFERHADMHEFGKRRGQIIDGSIDVAGMDITGNGVWKPSGFSGFLGDIERQVAGAMTDVHEDAAALCFGDFRKDSSGIIHDLSGPRV